MVSTSTPTVEPATSAAAPSGSGGTACIDPETATIIQSIRDTPANAQSIITEKRDALIAGLERFNPPPDAASWRDDLMKAIQNGDAAAVQTKLQAIGSEVKIAFC